MVESDTLTWNGDTEGKVIVESDALPDMPFVKVSDAIPTLAELQEGFTITWDNGQSYECGAADLEEGEGYIRVDYTSGFVISEENTSYTYDSATYTFPKTGTYLMKSLEEGFVCELSINNYTGFTKPILKIGSLTTHSHDWYGKVVNTGNTVRSDDTVYDGFVKVSDATPTLAEIQVGGTLRFYNVTDGVLSDEITVANYLESPYSVASASGEIYIAADGVAMVKVTSDGTYFRQDGTNVVHSLTINGYTGFSSNFEKIPTEYLPEDYIKQIAADSIDIPTKVSELENDSGYLTSVPSEYVTESELEDKGYLTSVTEENLPIDFIKQLIEETFVSMCKCQVGLVDSNGNYLYDALGNILTMEAVATTTEAGLMSAEDKAKLDSLISSEGVGF